jgi:hypothetical protein
LPVSPFQAGEKITCECGKENDIPSLREIRMLEPAEEETPQQASPPLWGAPDQLLLIGIIFIGCGAIGAGLLWYFWPITPPEWEVDLEIIREHTQSLSLEQSMKLWERLGKEKWEREDHPYVIYYRVESEAFTRWLMVAAVVAGIGIVLLILSMVVPSRARPRPEK